MKLVGMRRRSWDFSSHREFIFIAGKSLFFTLTIFLAATNVSAESSLSLQLASMNFTLKEFEGDGSLLVRENGSMPGLEMNWRNSEQSWYTNFNMAIYGGEVSYNGSTQSGRPHQTQTRQDIFDLTASREYKFLINDEQYLGLALGLGYYLWERDILTNNNVFGLEEEYDWMYFRALVNADLYRGEKFNARARFSYTKAYNPYLHVHFKNEAESYLLLGNGEGARALLNLDYRLNQNSSVNITVMLDNWSFQSSESAPVILNENTVGNVLEPEYKLSNRILSVGWRYYF